MTPEFHFERIVSQGDGTLAGRQRYLREQANRFDLTVRKSIALCPSKSAAVLDVGRSHLSALLLRHYDKLTTLGLPLEITANYAHSTGWKPPGGKDYEEHIVCDLNKIPTTGWSNDASRFDLIVLAEVVEHLYAAPESALAWLGYLLKSDGVILCTTPNAASLNHRVSLLAGRNPYERLRYDLSNPGHIREYTKADLYEMGTLAGLKTVEHDYLFYTGSTRSTLRDMARVVVRQLWPSLASFQTIVYRRGRDLL